MPNDSQNITAPPKTAKEIETGGSVDLHPCRGCVPPERHLNCWSSCPRFARAKQRNTEIKRIREAARKQEEDYNSVIHSKRK